MAQYIPFRILLHATRIPLKFYGADSLRALKYLFTQNIFYFAVYDVVTSLNEITKHGGKVFTVRKYISDWSNIIIINNNCTDITYF